MTNDHPESDAARPSLSTRSSVRPMRPQGAPLGRLLDEFRELLDQRGRVAARCQRAVGSKTRRERRVVMMRMLVDLYRGGHKLKHLSNLQRKHVIAIIDNWRACEHAPSTMATYVSHLRTFCMWLQKRHLLMTIDEYCARNPELTARTTATKRDKSARNAKIPVDEILERARSVGDEHFCCQLALIRVFGLRAREAWLFRPHLAEYRPGQIRVSYGTKGGHPRVLPTPISNSQREALEWARRLVATRAESMIPRQYTLKRWAYRYYRLCRRIGLTRGDLGVTSHSFRHEVLHDLYQSLTGVPAPVRTEGGERPDPAVDRAAREVVSEAAGHSRTSVVSAYLGAVRPPALNEAPKRD